ncbi:MAG: 3-hydroxy-3-methylglutaryl-CoA reductase, partial [Thermoplasmata archaeon]
MKTSKISGFYNLSITDRLKILRDFASLTDEDLKIFSSTMDLEVANRMIENVVGLTEIPVGIATNFLINEKEYLIPMAIEE